MLVSVDVGRRGCDSVATVIKGGPASYGRIYKSLVNRHSQTNILKIRQSKLKKLYYKYKARRVVIDGMVLVWIN